MEYIIIAIALVVGILAGMYIQAFRSVKTHDDARGVLYIDSRDAGRDPVLYTQLYSPVEDIVECDQVVFDIRVIK